MCEQPRPEVVVLTLAVGRVVTKAELVQPCAVDEYGRMEERRAEEREPAHSPRAARAAVQCAASPGLVEIAHRRADHRDSRLRPDASDLALEPVCSRNVVRVETCRVSPLRDVERAVERSRQPGALV